MTEATTEGEQSSNTADQTDLFDETIYEYDTTGNLPEDIERDFEVSAGVELTTLDLSPDEIEEKTRHPTEKAAEMFGEDTDSPSFTGQTNKETLDLVNRYLYDIIDESKVAITEDGWFIKVNDSANVGMFRVWMDARDFEAYNVDREGVLGMPWKHGMWEVLRDVSKDSMLDVTVEVEGDGSDTAGNPDVVIDDGIEVTFDTIDPDSIRTVPDIPDMERGSSVTLPGLEVKEFISRADRFSDHISVHSLSEGNGVGLTAEGDSTNVEIEYWDVTDLSLYKPDGNNDELVFESETTTGDESLFSVDYFKSLTKNVRKTSLRVPYEVTFGDEFPATIIIPLGDHGFIEFSLAPRIQSD